MKKIFKFTETRSWYFELDVNEGNSPRMLYRHYREPRALITI